MPTRALFVLAEAALAGVVGGAVVGGRAGWTVVALAVLVAGVIAFGVLRRWRLGGGARVPVAAPESLQVHRAQSRTNGEVGVVADGHGFAAGLDLDVYKGVRLDLVQVCAAVAEDPSRIASLQLRVTTGAHRETGGRHAHTGTAPRRQVQVLLRLEPAWAGAVLDSHGGGAAGSRAALVAAVDRLAARLRRAGQPARALDCVALTDLLAEDTAAGRARAVYAADIDTQEDLDRLLALLDRSAPERAVLSLCVDVTGGEHWSSYAAVLVAGRDASHVHGVGAALQADASVAGVADAAALSAVLPLGGGAADPITVLTLTAAAGR